MVTKKLPRGHPVIATPADATTVILDSLTHWRSRALAPVLPSGLPVGVLTTILMPPEGGLQHGPWSTLVGQLCLDAIDLCRPVVYTYAEAPYVYGPIDGVYDLTDMYMHLLDVPEVDERGARAPSYRGIVGRVDGVDSTLGSLRTGLVKHEAQYGPALAILDNAEGAHPYARSARRLLEGGDEGGEPPSTDALRLLAQSWAAELRDFAMARTEAPTVAVWVSGDRGDPGPRALAEVSEVVITAAHVPGRQAIPVRVCERRGLKASWAPAVVASLPRFDWGFMTDRTEEAPFERDEARLPAREPAWALCHDRANDSAVPATQPTQAGAA